MDTLDYAEMMALSQLYQRWALTETKIDGDQRTKLIQWSADYERIAAQCGPNWKATAPESPPDVIAHLAREEVRASRLKVAASSKGMPESSLDYEFAWTPAGGLLSSILLKRKPRERLTPRMYWMALGRRINRMVQAEEEAVAWSIIAVARANEPHLKFRSLANAGSVISNRSEWLHSVVYFPPYGMRSDELNHEPNTLDWLLSRDASLHEYIAELYRPQRWQRS